MWGYDDKESIDTKKKNIDQSVQELLTILISQSGRRKACVVGGGGPPPPHRVTLPIDRSWNGLLCDEDGEKVSSSRPRAVSQ